MERLFIRMLATGEAQWALYGAGGRLAGSQAPVPLSAIAADVARSGSERRVTVFVPGQDVLLTRARIAQAQRRYIKKLLPFMVEDKLATPLAETHIVPASVLSEAGDIAVAAVKHSVMQQWLSQLAAAAITPHELFAEHSLLTGEGRLVCDSQTALFVVNAYERYACERSMLPHFLPALQKQHPALSFTPQEVDLFTFLCDEAISNTAASRANLLQAQYQPRGMQLAVGRLAKFVAQAAVIWAVGMALITAAQLFYLRHEAQTLRADSVAMYQRLFPQDTKIINPRSQMQSHIEAATQPGAGFLPLLQSVQVGWDETLHMQSIRYNSADGSLLLSVSAADMEEVNAFAQRLNEKGVASRLQSVSNNGSAAVGQLSIRGGAQ